MRGYIEPPLLPLTCRQPSEPIREREREREGERERERRERGKQMMRSDYGKEYARTRLGNYC